MCDQDIWETLNTNDWDNAFSMSQMQSEKEEDGSVKEIKPHVLLPICNEWSMQLLKCNEEILRISKQ